MMNILPVLTLALLSLALSTAEQVTQCSLAGQWKNDLGSNMTIDSVFENGMFLGRYLTAVSDNGPVLESPLVGYQQLTDLPTFGFAVKWKDNNEASITVFTGQCFLDKSGQKVLQTSWLLRTGTADAQNNWSQTRVGYDTFSQLQRKN